VLVVDDEPAVAAATAALLAGAGLPVVADEACDAVLARVRTTPVRLVVSELYVRCAEGPCVVATLKGDRARLPQLRVLVHTRHTGPAHLAYALAQGADAVVPKHAPADVLLVEVRRLDALDAQDAATGVGGAA
jgi:CheY-like chemotaxis protein